MPFNRIIFCSLIAQSAVDDILEADRVISIVQSAMET